MKAATQRHAEAAAVPVSERFVWPGDLGERGTTG